MSMISPQVDGVHPSGQRPSGCTSTVGRYAHNAHGVFIILFFSKPAKNFGKREKIGMLPLVALGCLFSLRTIVDSCLRELRRLIVLIPVGVKNMFSCFVTKV